MDILYAPWRDNYITEHKKDKKTSGQACVFCDILSADSVNKDTFVLKKTEHVFVILNLYPYNGGHLLIIPYKHEENLENLSTEIRTELMELTSASVRIVKEVLHAQGVNAGFNLGRASGAGIPDHLHMHVVPRWIGDTSFITTIGQTKNVSVDLHRIYNDLKPAFQALEL